MMVNLMMITSAPAIEVEKNIFSLKAPFGRFFIGDLLKNYGDLLVPY